MRPLEPGFVRFRKLVYENLYGRFRQFCFIGPAYNQLLWKVGSVLYCRGGIFEKRESELSSRFRASTVPHRRYRLEPVFRTKLCKTGTQQVPSRVPRYYYILVSKGSGILVGVFWSRFDLRQRRNQKFLGDDQGCLKI